MNNLSIFFNTKIENAGFLASVGDTCFAPFRYLCQGNTVRIFHNDIESEIIVHHVRSFHIKGAAKTSRTATNPQSLHASTTNVFKTIISVVLILPGLILGTPFKVLAYAFQSTRKSHRLTKEHFTPILVAEIASPYSELDRKALMTLIILFRNAHKKNSPIERLHIKYDSSNIYTCTILENNQSLPLPEGSLNYARSLKMNEWSAESVFIPESAHSGVLGYHKPK